MIQTTCQKCGVCCRIVGRAEEFRLLESPEWTNGYPCVMPRCGGTAVRYMGGSAADYELPVGTYFKALHGFGFGRMTEAGPERVRALFEKQKVLSLDAHPIGSPERTLLRSITFESGTTIHFASSNEGACIYLVEEIDANDCVAADRDPEDGAQAGAQDGRADSATQDEGRAPVRAAHEQPSSGPSDRAAGEVRKGPTIRLRDGGPRQRVK